MSSAKVIARWVQEVGKENPRFLRPSKPPIYIGAGDIIYSYGTHFVLGQLIGTREKGFVLLNSERYSVTTGGHQADIRYEVRKAGLRAILIPFASLRGAGIDDALRKTITPIEIQDDEFVQRKHTAPTLEEVPEKNRWNAHQLPDGRFEYETTQHIMGESVFRADYRLEPYGQTISRAYFVSAFDEQERNLHYFLAQLPKGRKPTSVKDAIWLLRPPAVLEADAAGLSVTRQGDIFGVPTTLSTKDVHHGGWLTIKMGRLLNTSHVATEVVVGPGGPYARGTLYHKPVTAWGRPAAPEHRRQKLGDGKTWHKIVKNTVPDDRSWSLIGNVD